MFIGLGHVSYKLIYPFLYAVFTFLKALAYKLVSPQESQTQNEGTIALNNPYIALLFCSLAQLTIGIFEIISKLRQHNYGKEKQREKEKQNSKTTFIYTSNNEDIIINEDDKKRGSDSSSHSKLTYLNYIAIALLACGNSLFSLVIFAFEKNETLSEFNCQYEIKFIGFFYVILLCSKVFKTEFHRHHILSIVIIVILEFGLTIISIFIINNPATENKGYLGIIMKCILILLCDFYFSSRYVTEKWLMDKKYISPYYLLFLEGAISTALNLSLMGIFTSFKCHIDYLGDFCGQRKTLFDFSVFWNDIKTHWVYVVSFYIISAGIELFITLSNKNMTPAYRPIFDMLPAILGLFLYIDSSSIVIKFFIYSVIIFATLIYNEIVILHFCGLDVNIVDNIELRGELEFINNMRTLNLKQNSEKLLPPKEQPTKEIIL